MIIVDTREKQWGHIKSYFEQNNIPYEVKKLDTGDYASTDSPLVLIDRKANLQEVCTNLMKGKENRTRFVKECQRAFSDKVRFVVLVEGTNCKEVKDVLNWKSKYSKHTGRFLYDEMFRLFLAYGVEWQFCKKNETAKKILELLEWKRDG